MILNINELNLLNVWLVLIPFTYRLFLFVVLERTILCFNYKYLHIVDFIISLDHYGPTLIILIRRPTPPPPELIYPYAFKCRSYADLTLRYAWRNLVQSAKPECFGILKQEVPIDSVKRVWYSWWVRLCNNNIFWTFPKSQSIRISSANPHRIFWG